MKLRRIRLSSHTKQGICAMVLSGTLTGAVMSPMIADARTSGPGPDSAQAQPRGSGRIDLPGLVPPPQMPTGPVASSSGGAAGIAATALDAYKRAESAVAAAKPGCNLSWEMVAGIGRIESVHASGYGLRPDGTTERPIRGPRLDGGAFALIRDTDGGKWDGDTEFDRAVGPTQFIPSTWATWGADGNADGVRDPNNLYDAALSTGLYLCAGSRDLTRDTDLDAAILSYNHSRAYLNDVRAYQSGTTARPDPIPPAAKPMSGPDISGQTPQPPRHTPAHKPTAGEDAAGRHVPAPTMPCKAVTRTGARTARP
ncbi:lytic transglycosylase domain-containing protein [Streptomyces violascens]|uniref:lytic transglycosylase domain-containing protein n=1 Tax=Streptomyces violascens TaxID=67381 RepID=UPI0036C95141